MLEQAHTSPSDTTLASAGLEEEGGGGREGKGRSVLYSLHASQFISSLVPRVLLHTESEQIPDASNALGTRLLQLLQTYLLE